MQDTGALTLPQRRILVEAADYLSAALCADLTELADGALYASGLAAQDLACLALEGLGLFNPAGRRRTWVVALTGEAARAHLDARLDLTPGQFSEVLQAFVEHAIGHVRSLPDDRTPFTVPPMHARIGAALLAGGYLRRAEGGRVRWTDRIHPYMQEALLWDSEGRCLSAVYAAQEEAEARLFLSRLPDHLRRSLTRTVREEGGMAGLGLLRRHWTGSGWSDLPLVTGQRQAGKDLQLTLYMTVAELILDGRI
ncbi:hypothetical protein [Thetidibacter halocola]|uniref:Uncharacterized protein n=1 Tax=Thetidibacter halocola TaxID=2827239 RepID=A0A8J7WJB4_9RHOB|nr:hypothetical protein [Thetidibacter halocola]MBS0126118.1 hypothetical protein [Thetidibacter halocola]